MLHAKREARSVQRVSVRLPVFNLYTYVYTVYTVFTVYTVYSIVYTVYTVFIVITVSRVSVSEFVARDTRSAERATSEHPIILIYCIYCIFLCIYGIYLFTVYTYVYTVSTRLLYILYLRMYVRYLVYTYKLNPASYGKDLMSKANLQNLLKISK